MIYCCYSVYFTDGKKKTVRTAFSDFEEMDLELTDYSYQPEVDKIILLDYGDLEQCEEETEEELEQAAEEETAAASCSAVADDTLPAR